MGRRELSQVIVRMEPDLHDALKAMAAAHDRSMAQEVRYLIRCALEAEHG